MFEDTNLPRPPLLQLLQLSYGDFALVFPCWVKAFVHLVFVLLWVR